MWLMSNINKEIYGYVEKTTFDNYIVVDMRDSLAHLVKSQLIIVISAL